MSDTITVNGAEYDDLTVAFPANADPVSDIYFGCKGMGAHPTDALSKVQYSELRFPGVFDGVGTMELAYEPSARFISFVIVGTASEIAILKQQLNAVLVRADGARYTISASNWVPSQGMKLSGEPKVYETVPTTGGKMMQQIDCTFRQLSFSN